MAEWQCPVCDYNHIEKSIQTVYATIEFVSYNYWHNNYE